MHPDKKSTFEEDTDDAMTKHKETCNCDIDWSKTKSLAVETRWFKRKIREVLEIRRLKTGPDDLKGLNRDYGDYVTTTTWAPLFEKINFVFRPVAFFETCTSNAAQHKQAKANPLYSSR